MKINCSIRRLNSPQTNYKGNSMRNIAGQDVYTEYLDMTKAQELTTKKFMFDNIQDIIGVIEAIGAGEFQELTKIQMQKRKQIDNEPKPYNWIQRAEVVLKRIHTSDQLTTGIIDMYNHVVGATYRVSQSNDFLDNIRITIV